MGAASALALAGFSPLTGVPGPESALVLGLVLPPFVSAAAAARVARTRALVREGAPPSSVAGVLGESLAVALAAWALPAVLLAVDALRVRWCAPAEGLSFLVLGPGAGVLLAALVGTVVGALVSGPRAAVAVAFGVPVLSALGTASLLYTTPAIFAYGHFFGYFPGTLYDPEVAVEAAYLTFRALSAAQALGLASLCLGGLDATTLRFDRRRARAGLPMLAVSALGFAAALAGEFRGEDLGHRSTAASITERLGHVAHGRACDVVVPRGLPRSQVNSLVEDCDLRVAQVERALGLGQGPRITAFFFRSEDEKRALMGAGRTYIAKPWRSEVYLQLSGWPHPVLHHEIVHAVAARIARGPFRIAGRWGGWLPSAGIIEGLAVALAWDAGDGLTPHQWARAMRDLDLAPSIAETEGLGFLLQPASRAYITNGSFVRWVLETRGPSAVRALYRSGDFRAGLGVDVAQAERAWRAWLDEVPLPPEAMELAAARFERPAIFSQVCPHQVASLRAQLAAELASGDEARAIRTCAEVLDIDPRDPSARVSRAIALARGGRLDEALRGLAELEGPPSAGGPVVRAARMGIGDALWASGRRADAAAQYRAVLQGPLRDEDARQIEVRLLAVEDGAVGAAALRELLAPSPSRPHDAATAMHAATQISAVRVDGLGPYLEARQLVQRERFDLAAPRLDAALARGLPTPRLAREARRLEGLLACASARAGRCEEVWTEIRDEAGSTEAERVEARDWLDRLAWTRAVAGTAPSAAAQHAP